jgi:hypothetical protein
MLLVSGKLANQKVTVDDSSPDGTARIRVVFDNGKLISGAGFNYLFPWRWLRGHQLLQV